MVDEGAVSVKASFPGKVGVQCCLLPVWQSAAEQLGPDPAEQTPSRAWLRDTSVEKRDTGVRQDRAQREPLWPAVPELLLLPLYTGP